MWGLDGKFEIWNREPVKRFTNIAPLFYLLTNIAQLYLYVVNLQTFDKFLYFFFILLQYISYTFTYDHLAMKASLFTSKLQMCIN